jgi:hypothetical protein
VSDRIGEILVRNGVVSEADVRDAIAVARQRRMRLASALVTLGRLSIDDASRALAEQHGVPAALEKHLSGRDLALADLLPQQLAWSLGALPLAVSRGNDALVVCTRDPVPSAITTLERATGRSVMLAVAVEIVLLPLIQDTYAVPEEVEVDLDTGPVETLEQQEIALDPANLQLVDLDHHGVSKDHSQVDMHIPSLDHSGRHHVTGPFRAMTPAIPAQVEPPARTLALDPALVAITAAESRDEVVDAMVAYLRHTFRAGVVFSCKDGLALGQAGFGNDVVADTVTSLVVSLSQPSVLRVAHDRVASFAGPPGSETASTVQDRFFKLFGGLPPQKVVVVPVAIKGRVVNLLYGHGPRHGSVEEAAIELGTLSDAAEEAFVRIILEAKNA